MDKRRNEDRSFYISSGSTWRQQRRGDWLIQAKVEYLDAQVGILTVKNTGSAKLEVTSISAENNSAWISSIIPSTFNLRAGESVEVRIKINPKGLQSGTYDDNIIIVSNDPANGEVIIPITLTVTGREIVDSGGGISGVESKVLNEFSLIQNIPNPFKKSTSIQYQIPRASRVSVKVYDISGKLVRTLIKDEFCEQGIYEVIWDGKDSNGRKVAYGVYFCGLSMDNKTIIKKMVYIK
jgi:hypothetical protein